MKIRLKTIKSHLIIYFSISIIITMSILGIVVYRYTAKTMREEILQHSSQMVEQKTITVDSYFGQVETLLRIISSSDIIITPLLGHSKQDFKDKLYYDRNITNFLMEIMKFNRDIKDFIVLSTEGEVLYYSGPNLIVDYDFDSQDWFPESISQYSQVTFIGNHEQGYYYSKKHNEGEVVSAIIPVVDFMNPNRQVLGMILCNLDTDSIKAINESVTISTDDLLVVMDNNNKIINKAKDFTLSKNIENELISNFDISDKGHFEIDDALGKMIAVHSKSAITKWNIVALIPAEKLLKHLNNIRSFTILVLLCSIIIMSGIALYLSDRITKPIFNLMKKMKRIEKGDFDVKLYDDSYKEVEKLSSRIDIMIERLNRLNKDIYSYELISKDANIKALQAQINPHFLFNTLQCIKSLAVCKRNKDINKIVTLIGNMLRYSVYDTMRFVRLKDEINHVKEYMEIQNYRYPDKYKLIIECEEDLLDVMVLKLIFQPIIENSIIHGLDVKTHGTILINISKVDGEILIDINDNGIGVDEKELCQIRKYLYDSDAKEDSHSIGIKNVHQRIGLKFGKQYGVDIDSKKGKGFRIKIRLPYLMNNGVEYYEDAIS